MDDIGQDEQLQNSALAQRLGCSTKLEHGLKVFNPVNSRSWTQWLWMFSPLGHQKRKEGCIVGHVTGDNHSVTSSPQPQISIHPVTPNLATFSNPPLSGRMNRRKLLGSFN
jgi:hypothetical protein